MSFYVYMLKCVSCKNRKTYVGYTINLEKRLKSHNNSSGAKFTKGNTWKIIYKKKFNVKKDAMKYEYYLKKNQSLRLEIYNKLK